MLSTEFKKFSEELRANPWPAPGRVGYAKWRKTLYDSIKTEDCGCPGVTQKLAVVGGVSGEWLIPEGVPRDKAMVYIHGGSWALGGIRQTRSFLAPVAKEMGVAAFHFDYRLMPENPFPAGLDDCEAVWRGLLEDGWKAENLVLAGESAGANLTLALLLRLKDHNLPLPKAVSVHSPITFLDSMEGSHTDLLELDIVLPEDSFVVKDVAEVYAPGHDKRDPYLSPLYGDLTGLPPMQIFVGTDELLFDDSIRYYQKLRKSGGDVELVVGDHMCHSWFSFANTFPEGWAAVQTMAIFLRNHLLGREHTPQEQQYEAYLLQNAKDEIEHNCAKANLSVLAERYNQTVYGYSKLIKKHTGSTFKQLLKEKRFAVVERLLRDTDWPIKTIALEVGYENLTHFYDLFRKNYGQTPQAYRESLRE